MVKNILKKGLVVGIIFLFLGTSVVQLVSSGDLWWNNDWSYCRVLPISNPSNSYQMKIVIGKSSGGDVNCNGHCKDDFSDIRFIDTDNTTELPYWIENLTTGVQATFWVKLPFDVEKNKAIILYYGNPNAISLSNGSSTFLTFINTTDGWTGDIELLSMVDGRLRIGPKYDYSSSKFCYHQITTGNNLDVIIEAKIQEHTLETNLLGLSVTPTNNDVNRTNITSSMFSVLGYGYNGYFYIVNDNNYGLYSPWEAEKNREWREVIRSSVQKVDYYLFEQDGTLLGSIINRGYARGANSQLSYVELSVNRWRNVSADIDWIQVRKYASPKPVWGTPGMEIPKNIPPVANFTYAPTNPKNSDVIHFTDTSTDADGTIMSWWWNFGDHYYSDLQTPIHCYYQDGTYDVTLKVTDNGGSTSTSQHTIVVFTNSAPNTPSKPSGPTKGKVNVLGVYTTSTTDPNGDQVYYFWDWGDNTNSGWLGPYNSGTTIATSHKWTSKGTYLVKVKAKDIHNAESGWSDSLSVIIQ